MITENFTVKGAVSKGWQLLKSNGIVFIGLYLTYIIVTSLIQLLGGQDMKATKYWVIFVIVVLLGQLFMAGYTKMVITAIDGEEPSFSAFKEALPVTLKFFVLNLIVGISCIIGCCLLIFPGLYIASRIGYSTVIIVDRPELSISQALKESINLTKSKAMSIIGLILISILIVIVGLICLIIGVFPAYVIVMGAWIASYRMLQYGQEKAIDTTMSEVNTL